MDLNIRRTTFALLFAGLWLLSPGAQAAKDEGEITVNLLVNYGSAYKEKTWAPVDVLIKNEQQDVKGWVELRTYSNELLQSPIYRQPIELPKDSKKRVQFHCYFNGATRLTAQIYDGRRPMLSIPAEFAGLRPIPEGDLLCLVLDDLGSGFEFLYTATGTEEGSRGIHRETLGTDTLPFLSEYPQAYEPVDLIVLGKLEPERIGARQRELLYSYVRNGGVLAVCTGQFAPNYRGTWVEDLLGTKVGPNEPVNEAALADAVFAPEDRAKARAGEQVAVATLEPQAAGIERIGTERTLATRRPYGAGLVYTLAVDADSRALQNTPGYRNLWREIATARRGVGLLNVEQTAQYISELLPRASGITVHSKASVILYLGLYFLVAVVGNWLFFSWLKRREWAWAALIVFAIAFTAYAMVYGTSGRAQSSELHQVQVIRVPRGGGMCAVDSLAGILTAQTGRYGMSIQHPYPLAEDMYFANNWSVPQQRRMGMMGGNVQPFELVQGETPRIDDFRIGASELRMIRLRTDVELEGGVEGTLTVDADGIHGELVNRTGFALNGVFTEFQGQRFDVAAQGDRIFVNIPASAIAPPQAVPRPGGYPQGFYPRGGYPQGLPDFQGVASLRHAVPQNLFTTDFSPMSGQPQRRLDSSVFLCGWSMSRHVPSVAPDNTIKQKTNETLVVADVAVDFKDDMLGLRYFGDLRGWAAERTPALSNLPVEELPLLEKAVQAEVKRNPNDEFVSDLIGNYSQLTQKFGQYKPAADLAAAWGIQGKERDEAALWDRMIERWVVSQPEFRPEGEGALGSPLPDSVAALSRDDSTIPPQTIQALQTLGPTEVLGFVRPDHLPAGPYGGGFAATSGNDFRSFFVYALTELWSPDERDVVFAHGCDDWARIWINGDMVFQWRTGRDATPNQDHFTAHLKAGKNIVLVESGNEMGEWEFSLAPERGGDGLEVRLPTWAPPPPASGGLIPAPGGMSFGGRRR